MHKCRKAIKMPKHIYVEQFFMSYNTRDLCIDLLLLTQDIWVSFLVSRCNFIDLPSNNVHCFVGVDGHMGHPERAGTYWRRHWPLQHRLLSLSSHQLITLSENTGTLCKNPYQLPFLASTLPFSIHVSNPCFLVSFCWKWHGCYLESTVP